MDQTKLMALFEKIKKKCKRAPVVPVIRLDGVIGGMGRFSGSGLSIESLAQPIRQAFSFDRAETIALVINSPGGSPVQSGLIHDRIRALAKEKDKKVITFVEDVAASGGYWLALAGDEIFVHPSSIVGSIGVIAAGFGFDKWMQAHGIDRRVYTAGTHKMMLDSFQPEREEEVTRIKALQKEIHQLFIDHVKNRRGEKIAEPSEPLFEGDVWTGQKAKDLGLVDGLGNIRDVLVERYGEDVVLPVVNGPKRGWRRLLGMEAEPDVGWVRATDRLMANVEETLMRQRLGLS